MAPQNTGRHRAVAFRWPENRKVGGSTPPLATLLGYDTAAQAPVGAFLHSAVVYRERPRFALDHRPVLHASCTTHRASEQHLLVYVVPASGLDDGHRGAADAVAGGAVPTVVGFAP